MLFSEDLDWNRPQQRGNIISFCADELMDNTEEGENVFSDAGTPVPPGKTRFSAPTADYESVGDGYLGEPEEFLSATMDVSWRFLLFYRLSLCSLAKLVLGVGGSEGVKLNPLKHHCQVCLFVNCPFPMSCA